MSASADHQDGGADIPHRMATFRREREHPPMMANAYLRLKPSCLKPVMEVSWDALDYFRIRGVPRWDGRHVDLPKATSREIRSAARAMKTWGEGLDLPM
jgi:hypothetical protein